MNIGFTGHRNKITDPDELRQLETDYPGATWIHGGAIGFDTQVNTVALEHLATHGLPVPKEMILNEGFTVQL